MAGRTRSRIALVGAHWHGFNTFEAPRLRQ